MYIIKAEKGLLLDFNLNFLIIISLFINVLYFLSIIFLLSFKLLETLSLASLVIFFEVDIFTEKSYESCGPLYVIKLVRDCFNLEKFINLLLYIII